ncbi:aspartate aminotransferase [Salipiger aestuarii]|uniref:Aminotransferase n=1 Tax=Salipiger aestuarii TaxID=568098 RepID=A0A327Y203_9RHOB|nr:pyridoxal phosphate-dependent aminotransferase [Salipiger aestuarii]KAB2540786.1 aspartate aminotransferase [Salipiger aestuarii]RAK15033.1 arginine:pyruvate transaminase [Salipiger aestuarii]
MPNLSTRITTLNDGGSDGWEVFYAARRLVAQGVRVTELTIGEHETRTDPAILGAMHSAALAGHTGYADIPGIPALREEIARRVFQRTGVPTGSENVIVTPGGQAALFAAHVATCNPGVTALHIDPFYATYRGTIRAAGAVPHAVDTRPETGFLPDPERVAQAARDTRAASLLINTPNNPTGAVYPRATLDGLAQTARAQDFWVISDEVYDTQVWQGAHLSIRALPGMAERTLVVGSLSKSHAMTGSRIGWIVGPPSAIARLYDLSVTTTYGVPGYIQDGALFALRQGMAAETAVAAPFRRRRQIATDILGAQHAIAMVPSGGAMYLFLDVRATGLSGVDFANALLDAHRIAVMPGESFGACAAGFVRVAMTVPDANFDRALRRLCAFGAELARARKAAAR